MGLFSRELPPFPNRYDLEEALAGLHPQDMIHIRKRKHLARACGEIPESEQVVAVLNAVTSGPDDRGLLYASTRELRFLGERHGHMKLPLDSVYEVGVIHRGGTLMVAYGAKEAHFGVSFNAKESIAFFAESVERAAEAARRGATAPAPSPADELAKFAALHAQGVLTDAEFATKKLELLG